MPLSIQAQEFLDAVAAEGRPPWEEMDIAESRRLFSGLTDLFGDGPEVASAEDRVISNDIPIRIYTPAVDGPYPAIVYFHGGGWVLGDVDSHDSLCRRLAKETRAVVVSVDYRRSPEAVFPAAVEDCYAAAQFVAAECESLNVDANKLIVAGDSAGGGLAAAVSLMARDRNGPTIRQQVLIYPVLDSRCDTRSYEDFAEGHGLRRSTMQWFWQQYLGSSPETDNPLASPSHCNDLSGLPPAHVVTAEYDVLRDEGNLYAIRLASAGVAVTHKQYEGELHGFIHFCGLFESGRTAITEIAKAIRDCQIS